MERILVYSLVSLGDVIMATSVIPILKAAWPSARISMLVKGVNADVVNGNPLVDDPIVYNYQSKSTNYRLTRNLIARLKSSKFDASLSMDRHKRGSVINWLARIPVRAGPTYIFDSSESWSPWFYTRRITPRLDVDQDSRIRIMQDVAAQFTGEETTGRPRFGAVEPANHEKAAALLATLPPHRYRVGFCIRGNLPSRSWTMEHYAALIDHLVGRGDTACFLIGTQAQRQMIDAFLATCRHGDRAGNFSGETTLKDLAALMIHSNAFIGLDTGSSHLAAAVCAPLITLFGSSTPRRFRPLCATEEAEKWNISLWSNRQCSPCNCWNPEECDKGMACMQDITPATVMQSLERLFAMEKEITAHLIDQGLRPA